MKFGQDCFRSNMTSVIDKFVQNTHSVNNVFVQLRFFQDAFFGHEKFIQSIPSQNINTSIKLKKNQTQQDK